MNLFMNICVCALAFLFCSNFCSDSSDSNKRLEGFSRGDALNRYCGRNKNGQKNHKACNLNSNYIDEGRNKDVVLLYKYLTPVNSNIHGPKLNSSCLIICSHQETKECEIYYINKLNGKKCHKYIKCCGCEYILKKRI
jgi:hypothetical protein